MKRIKTQTTQNYGKICHRNGCWSEKIEKVKLEFFTKDLIDNFFKQGRASYAEGLASYTHTKDKFLKLLKLKFKDLKITMVVAQKGLEFFEAHKSADVHHRLNVKNY